jgi:hypothetical protein
VLFCLRRCAWPRRSPRRTSSVSTKCVLLLVVCLSMEPLICRRVYIVRTGIPVKRHATDVKFAYLQDEVSGNKYYLFDGDMPCTLPDSSDCFDIQQPTGEHIVFGLWCGVCPVSTLTLDSINYPVTLWATTAPRPLHCSNYTTAPTARTL